MGLFGFSGADPISAGIGQAISPQSMAPAQVGQVGPGAGPQAQQPGFWDRFNAFMTDAGPNIGRTLDGLSTLGAPLSQLNASHPVPNAQPYIGPGIYGLAALSQQIGGR